jgi:hypothetical protein
MTPRDEDRDPNPEQLAAYLDGEFDHLAGISPERVEQWLQCNPEAFAQAKAHQRLRKLWKATTPKDPRPAAWECVRQRIETGLGRTAQPRSPWLRWGITAGLLVATAASVLVFMTFAQRRAQVDAPRQAPDVPMEISALPIASDDEVAILSVRGQDTPSLVVGALPLQGMLVLVNPGEVSLIRSTPEEERRPPDVRMIGQETPMVLPTVSAEQKTP